MKPKTTFEEFMSERTLEAYLEDIHQLTTLLH